MPTKYEKQFAFHLLAALTGLFVSGVISAPAATTAGTTVLSVDLASTSAPFHMETAANIGWEGTDFGDPYYPASVWAPLKDAGITMMRTHDIKPFNWAKLYPKWGADPQSENSYDFGAADRMMAGVVEAGFTPFLRLGPNWTGGDPGPQGNPPNPAIWAQVAERIVAHYVEGWADGFHYPIKYVEIWNEPEYTTFYTGTVPKFYDLCVDSLRLIKKNHPDLKVGACGSASASPNAYTNGLIAHLANPGDGLGRVPLDFFSWHAYDWAAGSKVFAASIPEIRSYLSQNGYGNAESICSEFNPRPPGDNYAANSTEVTVCTLLAGEIQGLDSIFYYPSISPKHGYMGVYYIDDTTLTPNLQTYAQMAFNNLRTRTPRKLLVEGSATSPGPTALAGKTSDGSLVQVLISDESSSTTQIQLNIAGLPPGTMGIEWTLMKGSEPSTEVTNSTAAVSNGSISLSQLWASPATMMVRIRKVRAGF